VGFSYRKKKGPFNLSLSKRGPRVSVGSGCLVPLVVGVLVLVLLASCGGTTTAEPTDLAPTFSDEFDLGESTPAATPSAILSPVVSTVPRTQPPAPQAQPPPAPQGRPRLRLSHPAFDAVLVIGFQR